MTIVYSELGKWGRLGNQLWEIASTLGIAESHADEAQFNHWDYEAFFRVPSRYFVDEPRGTDAADCVPHLPKSERMYLQDHRLWWHMRDEIRAYFSPSDRSRQQLTEFAWFYEIEGPKVAVHVRRDERVESFHDTHPAPPMSFYERAIKWQRARFGDPTFCVFSDDIEWCRHQFPADFVYVEGYPRFQGTYLAADERMWQDHLDIFLMAACEGHIIPNSTFSWWGAALSNDTRPIYPATWYGPALAHVDWRLQIPRGWVEM